MLKEKYSCDDSNCLIIKRKSKKILAHGVFSINEKNSLVYLLNEPLSFRKKYKLPTRIVFIGAFKLNSEHNLELALSEENEGLLEIKGEIISVSKNSFAFQIRSFKKDELLHLSVLKLSGTWAANEYNQITFLVKRELNPEVLTFSGIWDLNKNQLITYTYQKTCLKTKTKITNTLIFEGHFQINSANRLTYIISETLGSEFEFRAQLESPNLYPEKDTIKYRIGIGAKSDVDFKTKTISLFGQWKIGRKIGLIFLISRGNKKDYCLEFGADVNFKDNNNIIFTLRDKSNQPLGINIYFTHKFLKKLDAVFYMELKSLIENQEIETGIRIPF